MMRNFVIIFALGKFGIGLAILITMSNLMQIGRKLRFVTVYLLVSICSFSTLAGDKVIVMPFEGFLLNRSDLNYTKKLIENTDYIDGWNDYYLMLGAAPLMPKLFKLPEIKVIFYDPDKSWGLKIVDLLNWKGKNVGFISGKKLDAEALAKHLKMDTRDMIIFGNDKNIVINPGNSQFIGVGFKHYFFLTEDDAKKYYDKKKDIYPKSKEEFQENADAFFKIFSFVEEISEEQIDLNTRLLSLQNEDKLVHVNAGKAALQQDYLKYSYDWVFSYNEVRSCAEKNSKTGLFTEKDKSLCLQKGKTLFLGWEVAGAEVKCATKTTEQNSIYQWEDLSVCQKKLGVRFSWVIDQNEIVGCDLKPKGADGFIERNVDKKLCLSENVIAAEWDLDANKNIVGCKMVDGQTKAVFSRAKELDECLKVYPVTTQWIVAQDNSQVQGCQVIHSQTGAKIPNITIDNCRKQLGTQAFWLRNAERTKISGCHEVTKDAKEIHIADIDISLCMKDRGVNIIWQSDVAGEWTIATRCQINADWKNLPIGTENDLNKCLALYNKGSLYTWYKNTDSKKIDGCYQYDLNQKFYINKVNDKLCAPIATNPRFIPGDKAVSDCGLYTNEGYLFTTTDLSVCTDPKLNLMKVEIVGDETTRKSTGCIFADKISGQPIALLEKPSTEQCLESAQNRFYSYLNHDQSICYIISDNFFILREATEDEKKNCSNMYVVNDNNRWKKVKLKVVNGEFKPFTDYYSLVKWNGAANKINQLQLPRVTNVMYRGMSGSQYSLNDSLRAMLGDQAAVIPSKFLTAAKFGVFGKSAPFEVPSDTIDYRSIVIKFRGTFSNETVAQEKIIEELNKNIKNRTEQSVINELVDRSSGSYNEWGGAGLYTTPYFRIAKNYGNNVAVIKETTPRGVDMTWYHYERTGNRSWPTVDNGEYMIPLLVPAEDVVGHYLLDKYRDYGAENNTFEQAFFKVSFENKTYIVVPEASGTSCLDRGDDEIIYHCDENYTGDPHLPNLPIRKGQADARAILALCDDNTSCQIPDALFDKYNLNSSDKLSSNSLKTIRPFTMNNLKLKIFYRNAPVAVGELSN
jgi:hypothetical protein